jgi:hypothetical protein
MFQSRHQNAGKTRDKMMANKSFENVAEFEYMRMTGSNWDLILWEIKIILNW